jgi:hypothetical protein
LPQIGFDRRFGRYAFFGDTHASGCIE